MGTIPMSTLYLGTARNTWKHSTRRKLILNLPNTSKRLRSIGKRSLQKRPKKKNPRQSEQEVGSINRGRASPMPIPEHEHEHCSLVNSIQTWVYTAHPAFILPCKCSQLINTGNWK